ncbi:KEOPS complex subunit Pcc1 [Methanococcus voltae]|uniref:KEOPS complex subunit Pcc1 n=2 Tax=Methanococcus voltae TaxID=2188 RepID=A0A8J7RL05_METVO|nr:KEOPS complex subunit Pcc1 [Methanococcus voltae]MBP2172278.1 KEOPS complex subunit Pcc1 [Methanococcus voltae]MBP2200766.1 KEOPS complex subunit Pcc1 [Methanococcus voltae]MCS3921490.1 KEOPS complex subunit Pcc1 [Methanococcus voltae PS]
MEKNNENPYFELELKFEDVEIAKTIYNSIYVEHCDSQIRSKCDMNIIGNVIKIRGSAEEVSILKASVYSYIRWIKTAENIYEIINKR